MGWPGVACTGSCIYSLAFDVILGLFLAAGQFSLILPTLSIPLGMVTFLVF